MPAILAILLTTVTVYEYAAIISFALPSWMLGH